ncbi:MAG: hypothetical protein JWM59_3955 [Verrucomicrobiales bacterium]|nr:hypothetical protein [Verrucomicrobiales bacterium]
MRRLRNSGGGHLREPAANPPVKNTLRKASLIPRTKSGWLTFILPALFLPACWDQFRNWQIRKAPYRSAAPVPELIPETASVRTADKAAGMHQPNLEAGHSGR